MPGFLTRSAVKKRYGGYKFWKKLRCYCRILESRTNYQKSGNATDWALDALVYRLRKHPFLKANGFIIESHKKVDYILIKT